MTGPSKIKYWIRNRRSGAADLLRSVALGIVLLPIVPDVMVDIAGKDAGGWPNAIVRPLTVLGVLIVCVLVDYGMHRRSVRKHRPLHQSFAALGPADILVLPLNDRRVNYRRLGNRTGMWQVPEVLCAAATPHIVIGIVSPQMNATAVDALREELLADGIELQEIWLRDAYDPHTVIGDSYRAVDLVRQLGVDDKTIRVDVTGGTAAMTLAMMRVAASLNAGCAYVSVKYDDNGIVSGSQRAHAFDPRLVVETV